MANTARQITEHRGEPISAEVRRNDENTTTFLDCESAAFFESSVGAALLESVQKEVAQPTTATTELAELPIPVIERELQDQIGATVETGDRCTYECAKMTYEAKSRIEELLEGSLDKDALLASDMEMSTRLESIPTERE